MILSKNEKNRSEISSLFLFWNSHVSKKNLATLWLKLLKKPLMMSMFTLPKNSYFLIPSHPLPHTDQLPISQPSLLPYFIKKANPFYKSRNVFISFIKRSLFMEHSSELSVCEIEFLQWLIYFLKPFWGDDSAKK